MFGVGRLLQQPEDEDDENIAEEEDDDIDVDIKHETEEVTKTATKSQFANFSGLIHVTLIFNIDTTALFCSFVALGTENTRKG